MTNLSFPLPTLQPFEEFRLDGLMYWFALCAEVAYCFSALFWYLIIPSLISDALSNCLVRIQYLFAIIDIHSPYAGDPNLPSPSILILIVKISNSWHILFHLKIWYASYKTSKNAWGYSVWRVNIERKIQGRYLCRKMMPMTLRNTDTELPRARTIRHRYTWQAELSVILEYHLEVDHGSCAGETMLDLRCTDSQKVILRWSSSKSSITNDW